VAGGMAEGEKKGVIYVSNQYLKESIWFWCDAQIGFISKPFAFAFNNSFSYPF
jgi:hypothetical protein